MGRRPTRGGLWGRGRPEEDGEVEPRRLGQVKEEASLIPGLTAVDRRRVGGARASAGWWTADSGRPPVAENPGDRGQGAPRKAAVGEDDDGRGAGHHDDDGGRSGTKKWPSAEGGGSLLLYIDSPLVSGRVTNRDKRGAFCHGW
jgi:hypothetical protein